MNNKMADDYMDSLIKEIKSLQAKNAELMTMKEIYETALGKLDGDKIKLQAENDRLRVIEGKARAVMEAIYYHEEQTDAALTVTEKDYTKYSDAIDALEDALKGGAGK